MTTSLSDSLKNAWTELHFNLERNSCQETITRLENRISELQQKIKQGE